MPSMTVMQGVVRRTSTFGLAVGRFRWLLIVLVAGLPASIEAHAAVPAQHAFPSVESVLKHVDWQACAAALRPHSHGDTPRNH